MLRLRHGPLHRRRAGRGGQDRRLGGRRGRRYDVQRDGDRTAGLGWLRSGSSGEYRFWSVRPASYPIPDDGPVGELLAAAGRGPMRPADLHVMVAAPGHRTLVTHVFAAGDEYLDRDAVFGVKDSLGTEFVEHPPGRAPDGRQLDGPWACVEFDIVLALEPAG